MNSSDQILDIAERRMRLAGYNAVSYRDVAGEMGIKSASLHYHFPKKEDLGIALVRKYSETFRTNLNASTAELDTPTDKIEAFIEIYRRALKEEKLVCLCAVLGAEAAGLPDAVSDEVGLFFKGNIGWLSKQYTALGIKPSAPHAKTTLSLLEGAMIVSAVNGDHSVFDAAAEHIVDALQYSTDR